jgi:hypothetical protein
VATALAQIMYYHKWPEDYTTEIPAYDYTHSSWNNETQSWNTPNTEALPATKFDWSNMANVYLPNASEASREAVAKLMRYCGQAFWMQYGTDESGSSLGFYPALQYYFGYSDKVRLASFSYYSPTEWDQLIYNELQQNRPVLYSSSSYFRNHAFVCDGYDGQGYYHMNLGYEGNFNGWYLLRILNGNHNLDIVGFGMPQAADAQPEAIVGIQKPDINATDPMTLPATVSLQYDEGNEAFVMQCYNLSDTEQTLEAGIRGYDTTTGAAAFEFFGEVHLPANQYGTGTIPASVYSFAEGIRYRLCTIWRQKGEETWHVVDAQSIEVIKWGSSLVEQLKSGLNVGIDMIGQLVEGNGSANWAIVTIDNNGEFDLKENFSIDIIDKSTGYTIQHHEYYASLASGEQCKIKDNFREFALGSYYHEGNYEIKVIVKNCQIASQEFHISKKMNVTISNLNTPKLDWKSKSFKVMVVNKDTEHAYDKAVWGYIAPRSIYYQEPVGLSSPYFQDCQLIKSGKLYIEPGDSAWVTIPYGDANIDLLSSAMFVVCQNIDEERYESFNGECDDGQVWYWEYGDFWGTDANGDEVQYTNNYIMVYDKFDYKIPIFSASCYVIDDASKVCIAHEVHGGDDTVIVPGKMKHPESGEWYSVIGINYNMDITQAKSVAIGEGITCLNGENYEHTFRFYNDKMESLTLPASLNHLTNTTLSLAATPNLKYIYCKATVPPVIESNGGGNNVHGLLYEGQAQVTYHPSGEVWIPTKADYSNITLYVPTGCREAYAEAWSSFINIVEMDVKDMPSTANIVEEPGDINGDGVVDVSDYIGVANHILGQTQVGFNEQAADVNGDGVIDVSDYIGVANIILTGSPYGN